MILLLSGIGRNNRDRKSPAGIAGTIQQLPGIDS
jgi:hypothetical protein